MLQTLSMKGPAEKHTGLSALYDTSYLNYWYGKTGHGHDLSELLYDVILADITLKAQIKNKNSSYLGCLPYVASFRIAARGCLHMS